ncbi:hypothetical protein AHAS_Ahas11G0356400 [Arachis hypogaea]
MEDFRSKSYGDGRMQIEPYTGPTGNGTTATSGDVHGMQDLRCYSASYASSVHPTQIHVANDPKFKKGKSTNGSTSKSWSFSDPELQRKKRVASYKVYAVEGKLKGSLRKSFKWLKDSFGSSARVEVHKDNRFTFLHGNDVNPEKDSIMLLSRVTFSDLVSKSSIKERKLQNIVTVDMHIGHWILIWQQSYTGQWLDREIHVLIHVSDISAANDFGFPIFDQPKRDIPQFSPRACSLQYQHRRLFKVNQTSD